MTDKFETWFSEDNACLYARILERQFTLKLAVELAEEFDELGKGHRISGVLLDLTSTTSKSSSTEKYKFAYGKTADLGIPRSWKIALVRKKEDQSFTFLCTVMLNAGYTIRLFDTVPEAETWLKSSAGK